MNFTKCKYNRLKTMLTALWRAYLLTGIVLHDAEWKRIDGLICGFYGISRSNSRPGFFIICGIFSIHPRRRHGAIYPHGVGHSMPLKSSVNRSGCIGARTDSNHADSISRKEQREIKCNKICFKLYSWMWLPFWMYQSDRQTAIRLTAGASQYCGLDTRTGATA